MSTNHILTLPAMLLACLTVGACQTVEQDAEPGTGPDGLPEGTIQTGKNTFMIPLDEVDPDGCQGYRIHAPGRLVIQVIYYREASGEFTANKMDAACHAPEQK